MSPAFFEYVVVGYTDFGGLASQETFSLAGCRKLCYHGEKKTKEGFL